MGDAQQDPAVLVKKLHPSSLQILL
jgi:hypothetical protein